MKAILACLVLLLAALPVQADHATNNDNVCVTTDYCNVNCHAGDTLYVAALQTEFPAYGDLVVQCGGVTVECKSRVDGFCRGSDGPVLYDDVGVCYSTFSSMLILCTAAGSIVDRTVDGLFNAYAGLA